MMALKICFSSADRFDRSVCFQHREKLFIVL